MPKRKGFFCFILVAALVVASCSSAMAKRCEINGREVTWEEFKEFCEAYGLDPYSTGGSGSEPVESESGEADELISFYEKSDGEWETAQGS